MLSQGAKQYQSVNAQTSIMDADPHRLIQLLFQGATERIAEAKGHIERNSIEKKNLALNKAIAIVGGLRESLNLDAGEVADNLNQLYDYFERRLFEANIKNDVAILDEVNALLLEIKSAWDAIREQALDNTGQSKT